MHLVFNFKSLTYTLMKPSLHSRQWPYHPRKSFVVALDNLSSLSLSDSSSTGHHWSALRHYRLVCISRNLCQRLTQHVLFCIIYSTWHNHFEIPPHGCVYQAFTHFYYWTLLHGTDMPQFVDPFSDFHLDCFQVLAITKKADINICMQVCMDMFPFLLGKSIRRSGQSGSYCRCVFNS